jgi:hypothetical protein
VSYDPAPLTAIASAGGTTVLTGGGAFVVTGSTFQTLTLPAAASGAVLSIKSRTSGLVTINRAGSDTIDGATSYSLPPGASISLRPNGTDWTVN